MSEVIEKRIDEHAEFLREYVKLQLWFIWNWLHTHPSEDFTFVIRNRVDIYRKTNLNPGLSKNTPTPGDFSLPQWRQLERAMEIVFHKSKSTSAEVFENEAWRLLRPFVEARVERDFREGNGLDNYQCGSLRYDVPRRLLGYRLTAWLHYLLIGAPRCISFHIGNRIAPRSFFDDPSYLPKCFFQLMEETQRKFYAGGLTIKTWLNSYPPWLELFPKEWLNNMSPPDEGVGWSQLYWGQFITSRGTFNYKHARMFRESGVLPHKPRRSWCTFNSLAAHLHMYLSKVQGKSIRVSPTEV